MTTPRTHATPDTWSNDDLRAYDQLRTQHIHSGRTPDEAHERAVRQINEHRAQADAPADLPDSSTGVPESPTPDRPLSELRDEARRLGVPDPLALDRDELVRAIAQREIRARR